MCVIESLKSAKQKLYEKHIIDGEGRLKLYHVVTQSILLKVLEANGLETELKAYDKKQEEKNKND